ncbi:MAG TPA: conjugal transfer protein TraF [Gemmatimonadaceae bacterium]|nr:conjugal transfer protein TraF [Gemmatimonadaceae bacterium]
MIRDHMSWSRALAATLILGASTVAQAQLANASTAATGLGGAYTARAQGYNAVAWNPANLAMPGNQGFSLTLLAVDGNAGIKPIDFNKLATYSGDTIPNSVREQWMLDVEQEGGQKGALGGGVTGLALSLGSFGFQFNTKVAGDMHLSPGAVEALLFGNVGRTGTIRALDIAGSSFQSGVYSTGAISYGMRLPAVALADFAIGATAKYTVGHALVIGVDNGSSIGTSDLNLTFPMIYPDSNSIESGNLGSGFGLDLGAAWTIPGFRFGVSLQNVVNTFKWDTTKFATRSALGAFSSDTNYFDTDSTDMPYGTAPAALREQIGELKFKPVIAGGVSFNWLPRITVSADIRQQFGEGIEVGPQSMIGAGAELRLIPFIPLRGGVQMMSGGFGVSGGFGINLLGFEAGLAGYVRKRDGGSESGFTLNAIAIRP